MNKKEIYLSVFLLAVAFVILLLTLFPYRPDLVITNNPKVPPIPSVTPLPSASPVIILSPNISEALKSPQKIIGLIDKSWVFEGSFPVELFDSQYRSLVKVTGLAPNWLEDDSKYTNFTATLNFSTNQTNGYLKFKNDNPSGLPQNNKYIDIPVFFSQTDQSNIKLFYHNSSKDPNSLDCNANDFINVFIPQTVTPLKGSIDKLISQFFLTDKIYGTRAKTFILKSAIIKNGLATLTFSDPNYFSSGGSCRVAIVSDMIRKTALQFSSVKEVKFLGPDYLLEP